MEENNDISGKKPETIIKEGIKKEPEKILSKKSKIKRFLIIIITLAVIVALFFIAKSVSTDALENLGLSIPLPLFTFLIALIDGFNPCTLFVLTLLLGLLVSVSHSRKRIYAVGYTFVTVVYVVYFLFMAAWLNIFKFIGFIDPLRYAIAAIAIAAGVINCKELFFFKKGISLTIQEKHKAPLFKRMRKVREIIVNGSIPALIGASIILAAFASLIELPCTAGFPMVYTGILTGKALSGLGYYLYLLFYTAVYIIPLSVIIAIFGFTFQKKTISKKQMQIIKFIGGAIMVILGIILLVNPGILMGI